MRVVIATLAAASLLIAACNSCGPKEAPEPPPLTADVSLTAPSDVSGAAPKDVAVESTTTPDAKVHQTGRKIREAPKTSLKMAPIRKCPQGGCEFQCDMMNRCLFTCDGGDCHQVCGPDSSCTATCKGGGCVQQCHASAGCTLRCRGGQCDQQCDARSACSRTCNGGDCKVCQGENCKVQAL